MEGSDDSISETSERYNLKLLQRMHTQIPRNNTLKRTMTNKPKPKVGVERAH